METVEEVKVEANRKMTNSLASFKKDVAGVRTGRVSADLLKSVMVEYYGALTPLLQLATVNVLDANTLQATPYDPAAAKMIEKAINNEGDLGLNAITDGVNVRVPVPILTEERRKQMVRHVRKLGEDGKVSLRHVRRDANDHLKQLEKQKTISKDQNAEGASEIQTITDRAVKEVDALILQKEKELTEI